MTVPAIANLIHETTTDTGTGNLTLTPYSQSFNQAFGNGATTDVYYYFIQHRTLAEWEWGTGHMSSATSLVRDTVVESSNSNAAVNFSAGTKDVCNDLPARAVIQVQSTDTGISRLSAADIAFGNGTPGDFSAAIACSSLGLNIDPNGGSAVGWIDIDLTGYPNSAAPAISIEAGQFQGGGGYIRYTDSFFGSNWQNGVGLINGAGSGEAFYVFREFGGGFTGTGLTHLAIWDNGGSTTVGDTFIGLTSRGVFNWNSDAQYAGLPGATGGATPDTGLSRVGAGIVGAGNGTQGDSSGTVSLAKATSPSSELILEQTGDTFGATSLHLQNRAGANGAVFENDGVDLVDFGFAPSSSLTPGTYSQANIRWEHRDSSVLSGNNSSNSGAYSGEWQLFIGATNPGGATIPLSIGHGAYGFSIFGFPAYDFNNTAPGGHFWQGDVYDLRPIGGSSILDYGVTDAGAWRVSQVPFGVAAFTVGTLPGGVVGQMVYVTDGDAALAWGATVINSGAGATPYLVWYNGTNWTVTGK